MKSRLLARFSKPISGGQFLATGLALLTVKFLIDYNVAYLFIGIVWLPWDYLNLRWRLLSASETVERETVLLLLAISLPFIWIGLELVFRRLRTLCWPIWLLCLFFVPYLNLLFFLALSLANPKINSEEAEEFDLAASRKARWRAIRMAVVGSAIGLVLIGFATTILTSYGWGLFVGVPFILGFLPGFNRSSEGPGASFGQVVKTTLGGTAAVAVVLLLLGGEGLICLVMAAPLALIIALLGAFFGWIAQRLLGSSRSAELNCFVVALVPLICCAEKAASPEPRLIAVTTAIEVEAAPEIVWQRVIAFPRLPPPRELIFLAGIAYPIEATITGCGPGAERRCVFSTGAFVEPIEIWDEPSLLRFTVTENPSPMSELSPYEIHPPHLRGFLESQAGQFKLTPLAPGRTRLEGTTWYRHGLWPHDYWRLWSDYIIHTIHLRVLNHVKSLAEAGPGA